MKKYLFPYDLIERNEKIILYGGGGVGRCYIEQIENNQYCEIASVADANFAQITMRDIPVLEPEELKKLEYDKILVSTEIYKDEVLSLLENMGIRKDKIVVSDFFSCNIDTPESIVIKTVFDALGIKKPSYIDVGACHPYNLSNTMLFYYYGSRGINIEPEKSLAPEFKKYRPEDINLFVGVAEKRGEAKFYRSHEPSLSTFNASTKEWSAAHHRCTYYDDYVMVPMRTLNDIVDEYLNGKFPDFIDIDVEGMDQIVLASCDFSKSSPKLICVEGRTAVFNELLMNKKCAGGSYRPYCKVGVNTIYLRDDIYDKVLSL